MKRKVYIKPITRQTMIAVRRHLLMGSGNFRVADRDEIGVYNDESYSAEDALSRGYGSWDDE